MSGPAHPPWRRAVRPVAALLLLAASPAVAAPAEWAVSAGAFNVLNHARPEAGFEARLRPFELPVGGLELVPAVGLSGNADGGLYAYGSLRLDLLALLAGGDAGAGAAEERPWRLVAFTGAGWYDAGDGKDLGGPVEFRSGIEAARRVGRRSRLGLAFYHLSNGILYDSNPGAESLVLVWSWR